MYNLIVYMCANLYCLIVSLCFYISNNKKLKNAKTEHDIEQYTQLKIMMKGMVSIFVFSLVLELIHLIVLLIKGNI